MYSIFCFVAYAFYFFKQKTAYDLRISDWSSDVCSSDLLFRAFLYYEGAEKVIEKFGGAKHGATLEDVIEDPVAFEHARVSGAIRTDLILSAEIMAITLSEVAAQELFVRAGVLALVGVLITIAEIGRAHV